MKLNLWNNSLSKNKLSLFPMLFDYDFKNKRPRGASLKLDILSGGSLSSCIDALGEVYLPVFLKKTEIPAKNGLFLLDFKQLHDLEKFMEDFMNNNNFTHVYVEKNLSLSCGNLKDRIKRIDDF